MSDNIADQKKSVRRAFRLGTYTTVLAVIWTAIIGVSLMWNVHEQGRATKEVARTQARVGFDKDVLYRRWNAMHGGVYVPATETTIPNPHLDVHERDIETPAGRALTLINPASMTRQVHELGAQTNGVQGHITSLTPIRPENVADRWETAALEAFERGVPEHSSIEEFRGEPHLRLMRPLMTEKGCLKCHAAQGYQVGDVRGGISVSVPMAPLQAAGRATMISIAVCHAFFWALGLGGIGLAYRHLRAHIRERNRAEERLLRSRTKFRTLYNSTSDAVMLLDEKSFFDCNDATVRIFGCKDKAEFRTKHPADLSPAEQPCGTDSMTLANRRIATALEKGSNQFEWIHQRQDTNKAFPAEVLLNALELDGRPVLQAVVRDVTKRKQAEEERDRSRNTFQKILESMPVGMAIIGRDKIVRQVNSAALAMMEYDSDEQVVGCECHQTLCASPRDKCPVLDLGMAAGTTERVLVTKDKTKVPILKTVVPLTLNDEDVLLETFVDITERKRAEQQIQDYAAALEGNNLALEQLNESVEAADRAKSEFLAN
ncbi:MAG: DUF3365 domain-containing protein, partial [Planctomycetes bacterium]|nr:DUF3365 domain-containing protein [Planctomycetota bacterium]